MPLKRSYQNDPAAQLGTTSDDLVDSYVAWREASAGVQAAYERWEKSRLPNRDAAFGGYLAALQREHHAARIYREHMAKQQAGRP